ncbi:MAG: HK97 family phage prohead protease [Dehalogenimonas sp.]|nr:HK97 family phage prohead protease [Dehalogenimonas sp.]
MERKTVKFEVKAVDEETGIFEGYGSTFTRTPDSYGDVVDKGAFSKTIQEGSDRIKVLWNHDSHEPIGKPLELTEDEHGLKIKGKLSMGVQRAREVLALMKDGVVNQMSIGYDTITEVVEDGVRHLKEVRLWDVSPVTFAANPTAVIMSAKSGRVLSATNVNKLREAIDALQALLDAAGTEEPEKSTPTSPEAKEAAQLESAVDELTSALSGFDAIKAQRRIEGLLKELGGISHG